MTEDQLLEALITEYETAAHVAAASRVRRRPIWLLAPIRAGDQSPARYLTVHYTPAAADITPAQRAALIHCLPHDDVGDGGRWQIWTVQRWEDLTPAESADTRPSAGDSPEGPP